jgi:serine/threonine protein kinase
LYNSLCRYVALELCVGTLRDYGEKKYQGPVPNGGDGLLQMARGLNHIHLQNYVHKEIKPENILIASSGSSNVSFKISDFGLCNSVAKLSENLETLAHQAPEYLVLVATELLKDWGSRAADIFALGCVFFYFLTNGSHPFGSKKHFRITNIIMEQHNLDGKLYYFS